MTDDHELAVIDSIYDALDAGDPQRALDLARRGLEHDADDPVLCFLAGVALGELDRPDEAVRQLQRAVRLDPEDAEFRTELALSLFRACRFADARRHVDRALALDEGNADAHVIKGLLLERHGDLEGCEKHLRFAAELDGERFPLPARFDRAEFERHVQLARGKLPAEFREHLERVGLIVEDLPSEQLLLEESPPLDPELLGLFAGVPIDQQSYLSAGGELPARIYLFQRNLERFAGPGELAEQIAVTLYHELGHYLGMDEDDLEALDFA